MFLGADTVLGLVYLGYRHAEQGNDSIYLYLGRLFLIEGEAVLRAAIRLVSRLPVVYGRRRVGKTRLLRH